MSTTETNPFEEADQLLGPSIPAASFPTIGTKLAGTITEVNVQNQRDPETGKVETWDDGSIRRQTVLTVQCEPEGKDDDGKRRLYIKGPSMPAGFRDAMKKAGVPGPRPGGKVSVEYVSDGTAARKGLNPPKNFTVAYEPPAA